MGVLASLTANINRRKGAKPFRPEDFMPDEPEPQKPRTRKQTAEEMKAAFAPFLKKKREAHRERKG